MLLTLLLACSDPPPQETRIHATGTLTFNTLEQLGPYRMEASVERTVHYAGGEPQTTLTTTQLAWRTPDEWELKRTRNGHPITHACVYDGKGWLATGDGRLNLLRDPDPLRADLTRTWDIWTDAFGSLADRFAYTEVGRETVSGRPAEHHQLSLLPPPTKTKGRRPWTPTAVTGDVWLDEATSLRLQAKVSVSAEGKGQTEEVALLLAFSDIGGDIVITPPNMP